MPLSAQDDGGEASQPQLAAMRPNSRPSSVLGTVLEAAVHSTHCEWLSMSYRMRSALRYRTVRTKMA